MEHGSNVGDPSTTELEAKGSAHEDEGEHLETLDDYQLIMHRVRREIRKPSRYKDCLSLVILSYQDLAFKEPKTYDEAITRKLSKKTGMWPWKMK